MILKAIGAICIISGSSGLGLYLANRWRARLKLLEELRKMILLLKGEILYANAPLEEAFLHVGKKGNQGAQSSIADLFIAIAGRIEMQRGEPFYMMWKEEIEHLNLEIPFSKEDKQDLIAFGEHLGYLDLSMQERTMLLYLEQLERTITYLREHEREKSRLYTSLGIMGGLFLTIVMC